MQVILFIIKEIKHGGTKCHVKIRVQVEGKDPGKGFAEEVVKKVLSGKD